MKLIYLNEDASIELDTSIEQELYETKYGFNINIVYKNVEFKNLEIFNCTEVHHLYRKNKIAFESDIHCTGFTNDITDIESVVIKKSNKIKENFYK